MKRGSWQVICLLPLLLLLLTACGGTGGTGSVPAADTEAEAASAREPLTDISVTVDRTDLELGRDADTRIIYTVTTPPDCFTVYIGQRTTSDMLYADLVMQGVDYVASARESDPDHYAITVNEQSFSRLYADVKEIDGGLVWTLPVDFGCSGLYGAGVRAETRDGAQYSAVADVTIRYPEIDVFHDGYNQAWEAYILRNSTESFQFAVDLDKSGLDYMRIHPDNWAYLAFINDANAVFCLSMQEEEKLRIEERTGVYPANPWDAWQAGNTPVYGETALVRPYENNLSVTVTAQTGRSVEPMVLPPYGAMLLCVIEGEGSVSEPIWDSCRAAVCYRNGVKPDASLFPAAAFLYERGSEILGGILTESMSDYEKVKAIHDWMLADGRGHSQQGDFQTLTPEEQQSAVKTSYGCLMGYGGDCMGWSDTFRMLCGMAGVACSTVSCSGRPGGAVEAVDSFDHSFNVAVLDGEAYYFDVYWDGAGTGYDGPPYTYFAMTSAEAAKSHTWLSYEAWGPPEATAVRYQTDPATGGLITP